MPPRPIGARAMTSAERQARRRERYREMQAARDAAFNLLRQLVAEYEDGDCDLQSLTREARQVLGMPPRHS